MSDNEDRLPKGMEIWKARHDRLRDAVLSSGVSIHTAGGYDTSPLTLYVGTDFTKTLKDAVAERVELKRQEKDYERVARQFAEVGEILGQGADSLPTTARLIVAERDRLRRDLESLQDSLDEQHEVVVPHAAASLPEPDATNPDHLRWAAEMIETFSGWKNLSVRVRQRNVLADELRAYADRLDAARSAEREREQRIEAAITAYFEAAHGSVPANVHSHVRRGMKAALDAAGLLRGGGRGE
ncbi:hypothetical protein [Gordonia terrae]